ncbi:MAG: DUF6308 family protein [Chloroflexi bacterium]|nr:DUF6308 family protein [Chloroflexota bacterium]
MAADVREAFSFAGGKLRVPLPLAVELVTAFPQATLERYDFAGGGGWNGVDGSDIGRLIASGMVGFATRVADALVAAGTDAPWQGLPIDARLEDATPGSALQTAGVALHDYFDACPGVGWGIASKLLHLKRPAFFPIVDSEVERLYRLEAGKLAGVAYPPVQSYWQAIRNDLLAPDQQAAVEAMRLKLAASPDPGVQRRAALSVLRLCDLLIWMSRPDPNEAGSASATATPPLPPAISGQTLPRQAG